MSSALKATWLGALRSGKYKQGKGSLRPAPGVFCCLGVLCEAAHIHTWDTALVKADPGQQDVLSVDMQLQLATMNDQGADFNEIADWIEKNL